MPIYENDHQDTDDPRTRGGFKSLPVFPASRITKSPLTLGQIEQAFGADLHCAPFVDEIGKDKGFLSNIVRVHLDWESNDVNLPESIVAKLPTIKQLDNFTGSKTDYRFEKWLQSLTRSLMKMHNCEVSVYRMFGNLPAHERPVALPAMYDSQLLQATGGARGDKQSTGLSTGYILMEDLAGVAGNAEITKGMNEMQLMQVIDQLASLHAWSLKNRGWRSPALNVGLDVMFAGDLNHVYKQMRSFRHEVTEGCDAESWRAVFGDELIESLDMLCFDANQVAALLSGHKQLDMPDVLVHGDLWLNNVLLEKDEHGRTDHGRVMAILDWQTVHPGSPAEDLARLLTSSVRTSLRRKLTGPLLEAYYKKLQAKMAPREVPFDLEDLKHSYGELMCLFAAMFVPQMPRIIAALLRQRRHSCGSVGSCTSTDSDDGDEDVDRQIESIMQTTADLLRDCISWKRENEYQEAQSADLQFEYGII